MSSTPAIEFDERTYSLTSPPGFMILLAQVQTWFAKRTKEGKEMLWKAMDALGSTVALLLSPPALKAYLRIYIYVSVAISLLGVAVFIYFQFYNYYMPNLSLTKPIHFQFGEHDYEGWGAGLGAASGNSWSGGGGSGKERGRRRGGGGGGGGEWTWRENDCPQECDYDDYGYGYGYTHGRGQAPSYSQPLGLVDISDANLFRDQRYNMIVHLEVPTSPSNRAIGNFMINLAVHGNGRRAKDVVPPRGGSSGVSGGGEGVGSDDFYSRDHKSKTGATQASQKNSRSSKNKNQHQHPNQNQNDNKRWSQTDAGGSKRISTITPGGAGGNDLARLEVLKHSSRPAILRYRSEWIDIIQKIVALPMYLAGWFEESETLHIPMMENFKMVGRPADTGSPSMISIQLESHQGRPPLQIYRAHVEIVAQLDGLRYAMYHYFFTTSAILIAALWATALFAFFAGSLVLATVFGLNGSEVQDTSLTLTRPKQEQKTKHRNRVSTSSTMAGSVSQPSVDTPLGQARGSGDNDNDDDDDAATEIIHTRQRVVYPSPAPTDEGDNHDGENGSPFRLRAPRDRSLEGAGRQERPYPVSQATASTRANNPGQLREGMRRFM